jgi:DNA-binding CsgD family transcriptional regulator
MRRVSAASGPSQRKQRPHARIVPGASGRIRVAVVASSGTVATASRAEGLPDPQLIDDPPEQLLAAIRTIARGEALLSPSVTKRVIEQFTRTPRPTPPKALDRLTERELDVFRLIARGLSNAEIGSELYIGDTTVKTHITHILQKLGLRDRVQVVVLAHERGLLGADAVARTDRTWSPRATLRRLPQTPTGTGAPRRDTRARPARLERRSWRARPRTRARRSGRASATAGRS